MNSKDFREKYGSNAKMCPRCRSTDLEMQRINSYVTVNCCFCGLIGPRKESVSASIQAWNTRSEGERCLFCGGDIIKDECTQCHATLPYQSLLQQDYFCCFIDLLGFSQYTLNYTIQDCVGLIENYVTVFQGRSVNGDYKSFSFFHPVSDGIFIIGKKRDANGFIKDLCRFLIHSYLLTSYSFTYPQNANDITEVLIPVVHPNGVVYETRHWFPAIFSGGISAGELCPFMQPALYYKKEYQVPNFVGRAVTKSVKMAEKNHSMFLHGARVFCDNAFLSLLDDYTKSKYIYTHFVENAEINELLWPIGVFDDRNDIEFNINNGIQELFESISLFYKQTQSDISLEAVYFNTLKLIYLTQLRYLEYRQASEGEKNCANSLIQRMLTSAQLDILANDIFDCNIWRKGNH